MDEIVHPWEKENAVKRDISRSIMVVIGAVIMGLT